jgi:uncharacterized protein YndB with AHSA1/START domain
MEKTFLTVSTLVNSPIQKAWKCWTTPSDIVQWNFALDSWHCPKASNDLRTGGAFNYRMEARDGSMGFDFGGVYDIVILHQRIEYTLGDNRKVKIVFTPMGAKTEIVESFEAENENPLEMQRGGWQNILDNFKKFTEST